MRPARLILGVALTATAFVAAPASAQSLAHMGHVGTEWRDTPGQVGLLVAAVQEAATALQHAQLAAGQLDDLARIQTHTRHVVHALDPTVIESGPGAGYGMIKAATGAARHIEMAGEADDASDAIKTHSTHVMTSANNAVAWGQEVLALAAEIESATDAAADAPK